MLLKQSSKFAGEMMKTTNEEWQKIVVKSRKLVEKKYQSLYASLDFGVYYAPEDYFVSFIFRTNKELKDAKESGYPVEAIKNCDFASQEQCEKEYSGNWFYYYK